MQIALRSVLLAAIFVAIPLLSLAQPQVQIGSYLANLGYPNQIAVGPDGALWYTSPQANSIGRISTAGKDPTIYSIPTSNSEVGAIVAGPDSALWFVEPGGNKIGRIALNGTITEFAIPTANSSPIGITRAPNGTLWFTESAANKIAKITTRGVITEYPISSSGGPGSLTVGPDDALWFTESHANAIGQLTSTGKFNEYPVPVQNDPNPSLGAITTGPDGALWFTAYGAIDRITTTGVVTEYPVPIYPPSPSGITTGPDGALWFGQYTGYFVTRITTDGVFTSYSVPLIYPPPEQGVSPTGIVSGPDGSLWFTENAPLAIGRIGQVVFPTATLTVNPTTAGCLRSISLAGSNFAPNEAVVVFAHGFGSPVVAEALADSTGSVNIASYVPPTNYGPRLILAAGVQSKRKAAASFWENPRVILTPASGAPGSTVVAEGCGYYPSWGYDVSWNGSTVLGTVGTDSKGNLFGSNALTFTVPADAQPGTYQVEVSWFYLKSIFFAEAPFTVN
jgi:virginiamycin B lyase